MIDDRERAAIEQIVDNKMIGVGIDMRAPFDMQDDHRFLRRLRVEHQTRRSTVVTVTISTILALIIGTIYHYYIK